MKTRLFQWLPLALTLAACGPAPVEMLNSPGTPAAEGKVLAHPGDNGNTKLWVEVKHLAPPEKVAPGAQVYVVWVRTPNGPPQNVGALRVDENLTGHLETVTPLTSFDVVITAEDSPTNTIPRGTTVLTAGVAQGP